MAAEAADRAFLDRDQHLVLARQPQQQIGIERLGEARIGDRRRQAVGGELLGRLQAFAEPSAEDSSATLLPSRSMRPLPISSGMPSSGIATPMPSPRG